MTILEVTATPRYRTLYPGELQVSLSRLIVPPGGPDRNRPAGLHICLQYADLSSGTWTVPGAGPCRLTAKNTTSVMLQVGSLAAGRRVNLANQASIAVFTGAILARELLVHARALLAEARPQDAWAVRTVRFRDPGDYNDLIGQLSARFLGVRAEDALLALLADVGENREPQMAWYEANRPAAAGETRAAYQEEVAAFQTLTSAWLRAARTQMAVA